MAFDFSDVFRGGKSIHFSHPLTPKTSQHALRSPSVIAVDEDVAHFLPKPTVLTFSPGIQHRKRPHDNVVPISGCEIEVRESAPFRESSTLGERARIAKSMVAEQLGPDVAEQLRFVAPGSGLSGARKDAERVTDCVIALVLALRKQRCKFTQAQEEAQARTLDLDNYRRQRNTAKKRIVILDKDKAGLESKLSHQAALHKQALSKLTRAKNKLSIDKTKLVALQNTYKATIRRKETEFNKLQTRLQRMHATRNRKMKDCFELAQALQRRTIVDGSANDRGTESAHAYNEVLAENVALRQLIADLRSSVAEALALKSDANSAAIEVGGGEEESAALVIDIGAAPLDSVRDHLMADISRKLERIRGTAAQNNKGDGALEEALAVIRAQDSLLQQFCASQQRADNKEWSSDLASESFLVSKRDEIREDLARVNAAKERLRKEQQQLNEDRERLDQERCALQQQKLSEIDTMRSEYQCASPCLDATPATKALLQRVLHPNTNSTPMGDSLLETESRCGTNDSWLLSPIVPSTAHHTAPLA